MPTKQDVIAAIHSGELFTPEYQEACRQRKLASRILYLEKMRKLNEFITEQAEQAGKRAVNQDDANPYAGKKSGDYTGD